MIHSLLVNYKYTFRAQEYLAWNAQIFVCAMEGVYAENAEAIIVGEQGVKM